MALLVVILLVMQSAHHAVSFSTGVSTQGGTQAAANSTAGQALNQFDYTAVSIAVALVSAVGLALVIRRGNFL